MFCETNVPDSELARADGIYAVTADDGETCLFGMHSVPRPVAREAAAVELYILRVRIGSPEELGALRARIAKIKGHCS